MKDLIEQIDRLSLRDTKTLSQKGLKAAEEVGELAKAILPYEGAHGTNHRVPSADKVAEECADVMLVAYSIMKVLGYSLTDIERAVQRKADYWQFLLDNEDKANLDALDFEIHITVEGASSIDAFKLACTELSVKPIVLDLYGDGQPIKDVMTSSVFRGNTKQAMDHAKELANKLRRMGFVVLREKIETVPWHPAAQVKAHQPSAYFEAHFGFQTDDEGMLRVFTKSRNIHLSRNTMKKGDQSVMMGTYRVDAQKTSPNKFQDDVSSICVDAVMAGHTITKKPHTEYSLFDTNEQHDREWIEGAHA
jgi:NTP pyrophosphatase (non-canonical NTP hydrolase)